MQTLRWVSRLLLAFSCAAINPGMALVHAVGLPAAPARWQVVATSHTLPGLHAPAGIAVDNRGSGPSKWMYVTDTASGRLYKLGTGGRYLAQWQVTQPGNPAARYASGVAVGGRGSVFVTDPGRGTVTKYSPSGTRIMQWTGTSDLGPLNTPRGLGVDRLGLVYVADMGNRRILRFQPDGRVIATWPMAWMGGQGSAIPETLTVGPGSETVLAAGPCYQASCTEGHGDVQSILAAYTERGTYLAAWPGTTPHGRLQPGQEPFVAVTGMAADWQHNRYIAGSFRTAQNTIVPGVLQYSPSMHIVARWVLPGDGLPGGIAIGPSRTVFVTYGTQVLRLVR